MDDTEDLLINFDTSVPTDVPRRRNKGRKGAKSRRYEPYERPSAPVTQHEAKRDAPSAATEDEEIEVPSPAPTHSSRSLAEEMAEAVSVAKKVTKMPTTKGTGYISSLFARDEHYTEHPEAVPQPQATMPSNAPSLQGTFEGMGLDPILVRHLNTKMGLGGKPTEIQRLAIPPLLTTPPNDAAIRDILIQAQTGSGKTLTYVLPLVQSLLPLSTESFIDRSVGTLAIILAPTRELARQIYTVLEKLLAMSLTSSEDEDAPRYSRWIIPGLLTGGSTKNHEKQRLRKGCPILVATPGRLLDHLQNTSSLDVGKCRWLVLDEADRLLEMGFEEQLSGIVKALEGRRRLALQSARDVLVESGAIAVSDPDSLVTDSLGIAWWAWRMRLVLCSATLDERVQIFAKDTLHHPLLVRAGSSSSNPSVSDSVITPVESSAPSPTMFTAPSQLQQHAVVVPPKLRLVALLALLRHTIPRPSELAEKGPARVIVFMSSTDAVDFHWRAFGGVNMTGTQSSESKSDQTEGMPLAQYSNLLLNTPIYRLHGSMTQKERIASLRAFRTLSDDKTEHTEGEKRGGVLLCTSVASRGLDLPDVRCVIQTDIPIEGIEEYVHRIGRTARAGRQGSSWLMLMPHEQPWLSNLLKRMVVQPTTDAQEIPAKVALVGLDTVLYEGYGGAAREYESRATDVQMALERWVLAAPENASLARTAFLSHIRAYTTHPTHEKALLNVNQLHLGHLAKAFALREAPNTVQQTAKHEHDKKEKVEKRAHEQKQDAESRRKRMMANLPTESM
ncbi:RNA helicase [Malassezia psittaci]|uniref:ATP-dependent RNA helicase n=1 Tax=Malassezia psittaci TaxID=1821823 RepID=A0AAF0JEC7_9BASI|nr:RNA helicase [Malassezia psittaci]